MRRLGAELGVEAMSLYRHVESRTALLDAIAEHLVAEIEPGERTPEWPDALRAFAGELRALARRHPAAFTLVAMRVPADRLRSSVRFSLGASTGEAEVEDAIGRIVAVIRRIDPGDQAVLILSLSADLPEQKLFSLADDVIRPKLEQVNQVGLVEVIGGREREIHVELDRNKLKAYEIPATQIAARLKAGRALIIPGARHEILVEADVFRELFWAAFDSFIPGTAPGDVLPDRAEAEVAEAPAEA